MLPLRWFLVSPCAICGEGLPPGRGRDPICEPCCERLALSPRGLHGTDPLPWWGAGLYGGALRELLLDLRRRPRRGALAALIRSPLRTLVEELHPESRPLLVPIPGWKRHGNPLPAGLCHALADQSGRLRQRDLLERTRPVLGQHHLGLRLRLANQAQAFRCRHPAGVGEARRHPLLIVDDIVTTGATVCSAADALRNAGWRVAGVVCLARTRLREAAAGGAAPPVL